MRPLTFLLLLIPFITLGQVKPDTLAKDSMKEAKFLDTSQNKQGLYKFYYANGKLQQVGCYANNKRQGLWQTYWENGHLKEETIYDSDEANGYYRVYTEQGKLRGAGYKKYGVLNGIYFVVDTAGNNLCKMVWTLGILKSEDIYDPGIKPEGTEEIKDGVKYVWHFGEVVREDSLPKTNMPYTGILVK